MIDAVVNDTPCVTIVTEEYRATQSSTVHFNQLVSAKVLEVTDGAQQSVDAIERIISGDDSTKHARSRFIQDFVRPRGADRPAAEFASQAIELTAQRKHASEIDAVFNQSATHAMLGNK